MIKKLGLYLSVVFLLVGCGTIPNQSSVKKLKTKVDDQKSVVLFSTVSQSGCTQGTSILQAWKDNEGPSYGSSKARADGWAHGINPYIQSDFDDREGLLNAIKLDEGKYYFHHATVAPFKTVTEFTAVEFSVLKNEVVYIGEYYFPTCNSYVLNDEYERDLARAIELNPKFDFSNMKKRIMTIGEKITMPIGGEVK